MYKAVRMDMAVPCRQMLSCSAPRPPPLTTPSTPVAATHAVERRQQLDTFAMGATVSTLQATIDQLEAQQESTINTLTSTMAAGGTAAAVAGDMASRTMDLMSTATANQVRKPKSLCIAQTPWCPWSFVALPGGS